MSFFIIRRYINRPYLIFLYFTLLYGHLSIDTVRLHKKVNSLKGRGEHSADDLLQHVTIFSSAGRAAG